MIRQQSRSILRCDGCGEETVGQAEQNALELRAQMYGLGWRYPSKLDRAGKPVSRSHDDVCGTCVETWTATSYHDSRHTEMSVGD